MAEIITDAEKIEELLTRSVDTIYPSKESLRGLLASGKQISVYVGIDPTACYAHLGHSTNYLVLERLHRLGHKIVVLVGDFTAMIGDPSDKTSERVILTREQVVANMTTFKEQIGKILDFNDTGNPIEFKYNGEWLSTLDFQKLTELASNFTVQQMLERDLFQKRISEGKPLHLQEFFYPLMQGYDSVVLGVDLEVGGTDQTFNMLAGRTLMRRYLDREKWVMTTTLLVNPTTGEKLMSKSLGTGIAINEPPDNMFGKVMALADEAVVQVFIDCTRLSMDEIATKKERLAGGENPKNIKLELAREIVALYHGGKTAEEVLSRWEKTFSEKQMPDVVPEVTAKRGDTLLGVLAANGLAESKTKARHLFEEGAVRNAESGEKITDSTATVSETTTYKIGKKVFVKIVVS
ncbi:tyrosine--tRNA ligase [Candidatus Nomurabacteria bacterium CG1_02_47_685]|nr:MAG: tyrosine--tRNA ligase [Candidatus Nomurabacteria bacterium CG1_02_47_685]